MAEPNSPADDAARDRPVAGTTPGAAPVEPELLAPPTEGELAETGEPTLEEIHAAAAGDTEVIRPAATEVIRPADTRVVAPVAPVDPAPVEHADPVEHVQEAEVVAPAPREAEPAPREAEPEPEPEPQRAQPQPVLPPAEESATPPPRAGSNRLVATAWVLLAAGLFEVLYFASIALLELLIAGPSAVVPQVQALIDTKAAVFAWLPVVFFLLLFELTVLLLNRAGRFAYVVASAVVALLVYVVSAILVPLVIAGTFADRSTAIQAFLSPAFILILVVAREVMLWTGFAIGSRGIRVRRRNKEARDRYDEELADA